LPAPDRRIAHAYEEQAMNDIPFQVSSLAQVIQLAVAPVFLLAGVGALLGVLSTRLARAVDAVRRLEKDLVDDSPAIDRDRTLAEIFSQARRARLMHWAIVLCTTCYLLICLVVVALFVGHELQINVYTKIGGLFIAAMLALIGALGCFLRETFIATAAIKGLSREARRHEARNRQPVPPAAD